MTKIYHLLFGLILSSIFVACGGHKEEAGDERSSRVHDNPAKNPKLTTKRVLKPGSPSEFNKIIAGGQPTFVYFNAPWCGECKYYSGISERVLQAAMRSDLKRFAVVSADYDEVVNDFKISDDSEKKRAIALQAKIAIIGVPNMFFFVDGKPVEYFFSNNSADEVVEKLKEVSKADKDQIATWSNEFNKSAKKRLEAYGS